MKKYLYLWLLILPITLSAQPAEHELEQLGGRVQAEIDGETLLFPVLHSDIDVAIQGDLATVTVRQTFANPSNTPLHATYLFPLNQDAAVYEMVMSVGDERIRALIQRIEEARATFATAKREGRSAALLNQHRPNMFTQDVANLMPGLPIEVTLRYVQALPKVDSDYQLVIPLVVGPRYQPAGAGSGGTQPTGDDEDPRDELIPVTAAINGFGTSRGVPRWDMAQPPALAGGAGNSDTSVAFGQWELQQLPDYPPVVGLDLPDSIDPGRVSIHVKLNGAMPLRSVLSPTHELEIQALSEHQSDISLAAGNVIANRDFVLRYRLAGETSQAGLLAHRDPRGGFFSLLLEPPMQPAPETINPREVVFVLDCSGSMAGLPIEASKALARTMLSRLRASDTFRIIRFSDSATEFSRQPVAATVANIHRGIGYLNSLRGSGGTEMSSGVRQALSVPPAAGNLRLVLFLTDGYIGNEYDILQLIQRHLGSARLFAFGVGTGVNSFLLQEMGRVGRGFARFMDPTESADAVVEELAGRLQAPVLTDIRIDWGELQPQEINPQPLPDLFAGDSLRIMGRYDKPGSYNIVVHGKVGGAPARLPLQVTLPDESLDGEAVALSWARSAVKQSMHQLSAPVDLRPQRQSNDQLKKQIIQLGLEYSLVTQWTSFVAVSEKIYNPNPGSALTRPVPLAQVKGVSELAYGEPKPSPQPVLEPVAPGAVQIAMAPQGFAGNAAPEPAFWLGLLTLMGPLLWLGYRRRQWLPMPVS